MEKRMKTKGTVTPLSSVLPPEEARKAANKVAEAIADKEGQLNHLNLFVSDNANLINIVKRLPEELHHDIMVPFGKAAFFPGRLIHTNEFLVLLGEGYYAERTSKQSIDILKRRGKALDSQVDALKGMMKDLRLEESFFNSTAAEGEEGLLEIREEYFEEDSKENTLDTGIKKTNKPSISRPKSRLSVAGGDEEDARIKVKMDDTKRDEDKYAHVDDKEYAKMMAKLDELEREEAEEEAAAAAVLDADDEELARRISSLNEREPEDQFNNKVEKVPETTKLAGLSLESSSECIRTSFKEESSSKTDSTRIATERYAHPDSVAPEVNLGIQDAPKSNYKVSTKTSKPDAGPRISRPITDSLKAFSGSIIEHTDDLPTNPSQTTPSQPSSSQSSKPVSRFKMQRR